MKKLKYLILSLFVMSSLIACIDEDNDELTGAAIEGGVVSVNNLLITYVVGNDGTYTASGSVYQGNVQTTSIEVYKSFTNSVTGKTSDEVLMTTLTIANTSKSENGVFATSFKYDDLIKGLTIDGSPLPASDGDLNIGDFWRLRYISETSNGDKNANAVSTKIAVGTRYAGVYDVVASAYWNSGVFVGDWNNYVPTRIIESVNATIYRHVGLAYWADNEFYFTVDPTTKVITVLDVDLEGNGTLLNDSPIMTCEGAGGPFESITCDATTSLATPDDANGKDQLEFTVGYFRGTGATREFYEKLVKQ